MGEAAKNFSFESYSQEPRESIFVPKSRLYQEPKTPFDKPALLVLSLGCLILLAPNIFSQYIKQSSASSWTDPTVWILLGVVWAAFTISLTKRDKESFLQISSLRIDSVVFFSLALFFLTINSISDLSQFCFLSGLLIIQKWIFDSITSWLLNDCTVLPAPSGQIVTVIDEYSNFAPRELPIEAVLPGMIVRCDQERDIDFDGTILSGLAEVEECIPFGQAHFRVKSSGDEIYAGSSLLQGSIDIKVERTYSDSYASFYGTILQRQLNQNNEVSGADSPLAVHLKLLCLLSTIFSLLCANSNYEMIATVGLVTVISVSFLLSLKSILARHLVITAYSKGVLVNDFHLTIPRLASVSHVIFDEVEEQISSHPSQIVERFELIDGRLDPHQIKSLLFSILSRSHDIHHQQIAASLYEGLSKPLEIFEFSSASTERDSSLAFDAVIANIDGTVFRFGSEVWLIGQGIQMSPNEVVQGYDPSLLKLIFAMNAEPVAIVMLKEDRFTEYKDSIQAFKKSGLHPVLTSIHPEEHLRPLAHSLGLSLESIEPSLTEETKINRIASFSPSLLVSSQSCSKLVRAAATVCATSIEFLNTIDEMTGIVLTRLTPGRVNWVLSASKRYLRLVFLQEHTAILLAVIVPFLAYLVPSAAVFIVSLPIIVSCYLSVYRGL
jgi:cation transport ATPase